MDPIKEQTQSQIVEVVEPKKFRIKSNFLQDFSTSLFLEEEEIFAAATCAEVHIYDALKLSKLHAFSLIGLSSQ